MAAEAQSQLPFLVVLIVYNFVYKPMHKTGDKYPVQTLDFKNFSYRIAPTYMSNTLEKS